MRAREIRTTPSITRITLIWVISSASTRNIGQCVCDGGSGLVLPWGCVLGDEKRRDF
jgi:hypothetical protein